MIPVKLTIKGVYSYQQEQTIDFNKLVDSKLFGIFGSVGSGKSTILEAISFALYDDTERLNNRDRRNYNMMNLKSDDLLIDFIFKTGKENTEYRFKVEGKRNRKNFDDVKTFSRSAYKKTNGEWHPIEAGSAQKIIGLNYKNFRRTVIIPQGKFQEFLQLGAKDRTQMLKEIFNLGKFELYFNVVSLEKGNNSRIENLQGQLLQLGGITTENVKNKEAELAAMVKEKELLDNDFELKQRKIQDLQKLKELFENLELQQHQLKQLSAQKPEFEKKSNQLKKYEYCLLHFKPLLEREAEQNKQIVSLEKELEEKQKEQAAILLQLKEKKGKFELLGKQYQQREQLNKRAEALEKLLQSRKLEKELKEVQERLQKGTVFLQQTGEELEKRKAEQKIVKDQLEKTKKEQHDWSVLTEIKSWFQYQKTILTGIQRIEKERGTTQKEINEIIEQKSVPESLKEEIGIDFKTSDYPTLTGALKEYLEKMNVRHSEFQAEEKQLLIRRKLEEFAANLHAGEPCPVCGSTSHPDKLNPEGIENDLLRIKKDLEFQEKQQKEINLLVSKFENQAVLFSEKQNGLNKLNNELKTEQENRIKHLEKFKWEKFSPEDDKAIDAAIDQAKKDKEKIELLEKELDSNLKQQEKAAKNKELAIERIKQLEVEKEGKSSQIKLLSEQIQNLSKKDFRLQDPEIIAETDRLKNLVATVEKAYTQMEESINKLTNSNNVLIGQLKQGQNQLASLKIGAASIRKNLEEELVKTSMGTLETIKTILAGKIDLEAEKKAIENFNLKLHSTREKIIDLQAKTGNQLFDKNEFQQLQETVKSLQDTLKQKQEQLGSIKQLISKMNADLKQKKELEKELQKLKQRAENINILKQLFKGSGFVNYISSVYLQELCNAANDRFYKLTRQQLKLELTEDNSFMVRDFLNDGKLRSVKTLSGGQTFQAALSLALSLAESVQQQSKSAQNFFFLDEGFGTLDKDTLQIVFETLKTLRKENRVVGVISHVEELQQEIDVFIKVKNDPEKGSLLELM